MDDFQEKILYVFAIKAKCRNWIRTNDFKLMRLARLPLLYSAIMVASNTIGYNLLKNIRRVILYACYHNSLYGPEPSQISNR